MTSLFYHKYDIKPCTSNERLYYEILNDHTQTWPGLCCWWCTNAIPADTQPLPLALDRGQYHGFFCCIGCIKAFSVSRQLPFSTTLVFLKRIGAIERSWAKPIPATGNYLDQTKFGPGTFRCSSIKHRLQTIQLVDRADAAPRPVRSGAAASCTQNRDGSDTMTTRPLRRNRKRHSGTGTLVSWLENKTS